jgi:hypothetical protein
LHRIAASRLAMTGRRFPLEPIGTTPTDRGSYDAYLIS